MRNFQINPLASFRSPGRAAERAAAFVKKAEVLSREDRHISFHNKND